MLLWRISARILFDGGRSVVLVMMMWRIWGGRRLLHSGSSCCHRSTCCYCRCCCYTTLSVVGVMLMMMLMLVATAKRGETRRVYRRIGDTAGRRHHRRWRFNYVNILKQWFSCLHRGFTHSWFRRRHNRKARLLWIDLVAACVNFHFVALYVGLLQGKKRDKHTYIRKHYHNYLSKHQVQSVLT